MEDNDGIVSFQIIWKIAKEEPMQLVHISTVFLQVETTEERSFRKTVHDTFKSWTGTLNNIDLHELKRNSQKYKVK